MSESQQTTLTDRIASLIEELSSIRVDRANLKADLDERAGLVQRLKDDVGKSLSNESTEAQKTYEDMVGTAKLKIQWDLVGKWTNLEAHFQVESAFKR